MKPFVPPLQTVDLPPAGGRIGEAAEDFVVEEIPAYEPSGEGEHLYAFVEKRERNTRDVAKALSDITRCSVKDVGFAGMKDRQAVARQWFSLPPGAKPDGLDQASGEGFRVLSVSRHKNKLRTGHLIGNRFRITLRDVPPGGFARAEAIALRLRRDGLDNYFGPQRFGRDGRNLEVAFDWLKQSAEAPEERSSRGRRGHPRQRRGPDPKLLSSVIQSEVFNRYAARRLALPSSLLPGEVVRLAGTGSHFVVQSVDDELPRFRSGDLERTGPMVGPKGLQAEGAARDLEEEICQEVGLTDKYRSSLGREAPGARRDLKLRPEELQVEETEAGSLLVAFRLPAGAFATQVIRELTHTGWDTPREF